MAYPPLLAAGAVVAVGWVRADRARVGLRRAALAGAVAVTGAVSAVAALPVLPAAVLARTGLVTVAREQGEQVGWPALVAATAQGWSSLSAEERGRAVVVGGDYGVAGAVEVLGAAAGLAEVAYSGHNAFGDWGPPPDGAGTAVLVGLDEHEFPWCATSRRVAVVDNGVGVANRAQGTVVRVCTLDRSWDAVWPGVRFLG